MNRQFFPGYSIGTDAYDDIKTICKTYGKTAAIIGGKRALDASQEKILAAMQDSGVEPTGVFWYGGEASVENITLLEENPAVAKADMIFAVGGGKAIDTGKVLAHRTGRPFFTFPTIASTCASCTSLGILYHSDGSLREYSFSKETPVHIFIDSGVIARAPREYLWAGIGDTMAKFYECTVSGRGDTLSHSEALVHIFIDSGVIARAPREYLWAGIGDTMAKFYECTVSGRGDTLSHSEALGTAISTMCADPLVAYGVQALQDCDHNTVSKALEEVILGIIVSTGFVSNLVSIDYNTGLAHAVYNGFTILPQIEKYGQALEEVILGIIVSTGFVSNLVSIDYNTGLAHAVYNGFTILPQIEKYGHLHGEIVFYGILILLLVDEQIQEFERVYRFGLQMGFPTCLRALHTEIGEMPAVAEKALQGIDVRHYPYKVHKEMILSAVRQLEKYFYIFLSIKIHSFLKKHALSSRFSPYFRDFYEFRFIRNTT